MIRRKTIQGAVVLAAVRELNCHPTADEIYAAIAKEHPIVSRTTVYRNLSRLCKSGEIQKIAVPDAADRFDYITRGHYHIFCTRCGKISDVEMDYIDGLESKIIDAHGFTVSGAELIFKGLCPECQFLTND